MAATTGAGLVAGCYTLDYSFLAGGVAGVAGGVAGFSSLAAVLESSSREKELLSAC